MAPGELETLRGILDAPDLARLRHREPPGGRAIYIMGAVLELSIARETGIQELILTDSPHRQMFFYPGDADISRAKALLKFLNEHVESRATQVSANEANGCQWQ
jgi:hypothetical protein